MPWVSPPSTGFLMAVDYGDLHLRGNGTFGLGVGGSFGWYMSGHYRAHNSNQVRLTPTDGAAGDTITLTVGGDSAALILQGQVGVITVTHRYVFRRVAQPQSITPGLFVLASINGRDSPLVEYDTVMNGERFVTRVDYDTLRFLDAMFYERRRSQSFVRYLTNGDSLLGAVEWMAVGAHDQFAGGVVLRRYFSGGFEPRRDTLWTAGNDLLRRSQFIYGLQEDRYVRR
jgi:hypothetical protein